MTCKNTDTEIVFEQKIVELGPCYEWTGERQDRGYPVHRKMSRGEQRRWYVHRIVWAIGGGDIPEGMVVRHRCDNPPCVRPDHLELGTQADNMADCVTRGRINRSPRGVGSQKQSAKLTESDVLAIRARWEAGERRAAILGDYPIAKSMLGNIISRKNWTHI